MCDSIVGRDHCSDSRNESLPDLAMLHVHEIESDHWY